MANFIRETANNYGYSTIARWYMDDWASEKPSDGPKDASEIGDACWVGEESARDIAMRTGGESVSNIIGIGVVKDMRLRKALDGASFASLKRH